MNKEKLERQVKFTPAYHKVHDDPTKDYGVGCVRCFMLVRGKHGVVHFAFGTGMHMEKTYEHWKRKFIQPRHEPAYMGYDVGYHSVKPINEWQKEDSPSQKKCAWLDDKPCWCDGSAICADEVMKMLVEEGDERVWEELEKHYYETFCENA